MKIKHFDEKKKLAAQIYNYYNALVKVSDEDDYELPNDDVDENIDTELQQFVRSITGASGDPDCENCTNMDCPLYKSEVKQ